MTEKRRVLVVDDDPAALRMYGRLLEAAGYEAVQCDSGIGAVELVERQPFDVVVMDLNMPGLDGWMAMSLIRARQPTLPVVILTGGSEPELEKRAATAGAAGFLTKPCRAEVLSRSLERAITDSAKR
jgi:CheY-like chemotaxis protein